jgi:acyl dehydratase
MTADTNSFETREILVIHGVQGLRDLVGKDLGVSDWVTVEQANIDIFARLTGDEQWIHTDAERAKAGPFGATVQHGFLTLGLSTGLFDQIFVVADVRMVINYGLNRVRFPAPLRGGSQLRMHVTLIEATDLEGGVQVVYHLEYEVQGQVKPCCVADLVFRYYS